MFRALLCSSSGGQNCIIRHLVSSHSVGGRPVTGEERTERGAVLSQSSLNLHTGRPPTDVTIPDAV